jgi:tetraacyldisaccharide 4'-kinase
MRTGIEQWLLKIWYTQSQPPWYLRMLVPLYRAGFKFDHRSPDSRLVAGTPAAAARHSGSAYVPLIVVGNITVGGSGKTPLVIALSKFASAMQLSVGIATTGYGRRSKETFHVQADSDPALCGDEPVLLAIRSGAQVVVAKRRTDAVEALKAMSVDVIISDDGLQSPDLVGDLEICVVDGARGLGNGHLLPAGPLREPHERLGKIDCIVSNGPGNSLPFDTHLMTLNGTMLISLNGSETVPVVGFFKQQQGKLVNVVAGIGNPARFFDSVRLLSLVSGPEPEPASAPAPGIDWHEYPFGDHHAYQSSDFATINGSGAIVMTEKDAVKCRKLGLENAWYLPVNADLSPAFEDWFCQQLLELKMDKI